MVTSVKLLRTIKPPLRWVPEHKDFTEDFLQSKSKDPNGPTYVELTTGPGAVLQEAQRILGRCLPPTEIDGRETGLVVGYVQSGKTMSFETVIALARDNGFGLVIVLAGTKNNLRDQSEDRLKKDLGIEDGGDHWYHLSNPTKTAKSQVESKITAWKKKDTKKSVLITVLKHGGHLEKLTELLSGISLVNVPSLIIDDESDQASLNTKAARIRTGKAAVDEVSTTYEKILKLRAALPHHSYLQYTATPQANLLLAQADLLNASFAELVTPGAAYTGGKQFFVENPQLISSIPVNEVPSTTNIVKSAPASLVSALRYFLLAAAHHSLSRSKGIKAKDRNRSMMVHPAHQTDSHKKYKIWIDRAFKGIRTLVDSQYQKNPAQINLMFKQEYASLRKTFPDIKSIKQLIEIMVDEVFDEVNPVEVNGTPDAEKKVDWKASRYWILVGGAKLDRGYTVEGLCVTYMPRPLGTSAAADTLQQRARFFGYKKSYLGLCRVFIQDSVREAFTEYVEHEEFVREALAATRGKSLDEWRRDFLLTGLLKPTRPNVVGLGIRRIPANGWLVPSVLQRDEEAAEHNRKLLIKVISKWKRSYGPAVNASSRKNLASAKGDSSNEIIDGIPLSALLNDFLLEVKVKDPRDAEEHNAMLIAIVLQRQKNPTALADVFIINSLIPGYRSRVDGRGVLAKEKFAPINNYFSQSADVVNDKSFCSRDRISIQLRSFDLGIHQRQQEKADIKNVAWFALNIPAKMRKDIVIEARK